MGIPGYLRLLLRRYKGCVHHVDRGKLPSTIDHAYIDANGLFYRAAERVYDGDAAAGRSRAELEQAHLAAIGYEIDFLFEVCRPTVSFTISVDGPAPRAKMLQQRKRRFVAMQDREGQPPASPSRIRFNTTSISPGTEFMTRLDAFFRRFISARVGDRWRDVAVVYSSHLEPGEAEHKIMDIIRAHAADAEGARQSQCVIGVDADLVMLTLACRHPAVYLLREDQDATRRARQRQAAGAPPDGLWPPPQVDGLWPPPQVDDARQQFWFVDVPTLRALICRDMSQRPQRCDAARIVDDYVVICFLVGNDFLPHLQAVNNLQINGVDVLLTVYYEHVGGYGTHYITTAHRTISQRQLAHFLQALAQFETELLADRAARRNSSRFPDELVQQAVRDEPTDQQRIDAFSGKNNGGFTLDRVANGGDGAADGTNNSACLFDLETYRNLYNKGRLRVATKRDLINVVRNYVDGLHWVAAYYFRGCPSWTWYYASHYAPLLKDLVPVAMGRRPPQFLLSEPVPPYLQLLCVLPPQSACLLPEPFRQIMYEREDLYPHNVEIVRDGCLYEWDGIALLPPLDLDAVTAFYRGVIATHGREAFPNNRVDRAVLFHHRDDDSLSPSRK